MSINHSHTRDNTTPVPPECPRCGRLHRSWRTYAECRWRKAIWVHGRGPWASLSLCPHGRTYGGTVQLYENRQDAAEAKRGIDRLGCGGTCWRRHYIINLAAEGAN